MQIVLSDHNCEGQAKAIYDVLRYDGTWLELSPIKLFLFDDVDLPISADDEQVWQLCQDRQYLLLTGNRTNKDQEKSLESTIRRFFTPNSLPVITIGNLKRVIPNQVYRTRCAERLAEIVYDLDNFRGTMRIFIP